MILLFLPPQSCISGVCGRPGLYIYIEIQNLVLMIAQQAFLIVEPFLPHHIELSSDNQKYYFTLDNPGLTILSPFIYYNVTLCFSLRHPSFGQ